MNIGQLKKVSWFLGLIVTLSMLMVSPGFAAEKDKSRVQMSWQEFRRLLKLDTDDITLTMEEFKQLVAQTGEDTGISYSVKNGKIVLPRQQFTELLNKMEPPRTTILRLPAEYVISKAVYKGNMGKKSTIVTAVFALEIFNKKGAKYFQVPILPQAVGLAEVLLDDKPALVIERNGWYHVTTAAVGHHQIKVTYHVASNLETGPQILRLNVIRTAITLLELTVPLEKVDISVPGSKELSITQQAGITTLNAVIPAANAIIVHARRKYTRKKSAAEDIPAKLYAETINLISIEEDALRVTSASASQAENKLRSPSESPPSASLCPSPSS